MKFISGILAAALTGVAVPASANAADMYTGSYAGSYKDGPAYASVNWSGLYAGVNAGYGWSERTDYLDPTGATGGGQIGYNVQRGNLVFGIETDIQSAGISDSNSVDKSSLDWFGSIRGRAGYAVNRAFFYGTGGFGYGHVTNDDHSGMQTGWVAGSGVEYKITPVWSVKAEYQYFDLGASSPVGGLGDWSDRTQFSTFRAGVNYFIDRGYEPLK